MLFLHSSAGRYGADLQLLALAGGLDRDRFSPLAVLPERGELAGLLDAVPDAFQHPLRHRRVQQRLPGGDATDGVDDVIALQLLGDVTGGPGQHRLQEGLVVGEGREHHALDLGMARPHLPAHLDPVAVGEADVEHGDVGPGGWDTSDRLGGGAGFAHDLEIVTGLEELPQPAPDDLVVVKEKNADTLAQEVLS